MDREEVVRVAREKLGVIARFSTGEYAMLARLLQGGERIEAMALAKPAKARVLTGFVVVATDRRLLLVSKSMVLRRERVEEIPRHHLRGARLESPTRFVLELHDGERAFGFGAPALQLADLVAYAAGRELRSVELAAVARRKLGRTLGFGVENELLVLSGELEDDEPVLDLAYALKGKGELLAVCPQRLVVVPNQPARELRAAEVIPYAAVTAVWDEDDTLVVETAAGDRRFELLAPDEAAGVIAGRIAARASPG